MNRSSEIKRIGTIVIGAGQAGLSVGYFLSRRQAPFLILDANQRVGDAWRNRWDSLRLFTPARFNGLAGMPFPSEGRSFPTKDQMADYLEAYAKRFQLPVETGMRVDRLTRDGNRYRITAGDRVWEAEQVVVAMAGYQQPRLPSFHTGLRPDIVQMHSSAYANPAQLQPGGVLIVGAGNSGAEIAIEVSRYHRVWMSGRDTGAVPFRIDGLAARLFLQRFIFRVVFHRLLTVNTPMGRKAKPRMTSQGAPLIRVKHQALAAARVERVPRVADTQNGLPLLADGRTLDVANVIWCTGFDPGLSWIDLPLLDEKGYPRRASGVVAGEPGLYFVGLPFLHAFSSSMIHGVARDAERIANVISDPLRKRSLTNGRLKAQLAGGEMRFWDFGE
jgi:putative flavoprotein involved in K+ transport